MPERSAKRPAGRARTRRAPSATERESSQRAPREPRAPRRTRASRLPRRPRSRRLGSGTVRLWTAFCTIAFVLSLFGARLIQLQGIDAQDYAALAVQTSDQTITLDAPRAQITDRNGVPLAQTIDTSKLVADPTFTSAHATDIASMLTRTLHLDYLTMVADLTTKNTHYVELTQNLAPAKATEVVNRLDALGWGGVYTQHDNERVYPGGDVAANLLGFVNADNTGVYGIEQSENTILRGHDGEATYQVVGGQILPLANSTVVEPRQGTGVRLTIDQDMQFLAQRRLAEAVTSSHAESGVAIVMDARTSQVLAMADYPTFDANTFQTAKPEDFGSRAVQAAYEPGSVEKLLTFSALIDAGYVTPTTKINEPQQLYIDGHYIHDDFYHVTPTGVGTNDLHLTAAGVIAKSSNIGAVIASRKMPDAQLYGYLRKFGLGSTLHVGLPGVNPGILAPPTTWSAIQRANIDFGQGVSVNALQMASAVAAIAHGGVYTPPSLIDGTVASDGQFTPAQAPTSHRVISASAAHGVTRMMEDVVYGLGGTGPRAAINGYTVAGKTGTAQRASSDGSGYTDQRTVSFAGFAPAQNPRFVIYVVVQAPQGASAFGGTVAGPVFHDLMSAALQKYGVPPTPGKRPPLLPITW